MICFLRHFKGVAYFLVMLTLFQSCVAYNKGPSTIEETTKYNNKRIKIITLDKRSQILKWIEEKDGNIVGIKETKKIAIDTVKIKQIRADKNIVSLEAALNHSGIIQIETKKKTYNFLSIELEDNLIRGIKMTGKDTLAVVIPKNQIKKIKVKDEGASAIGNLLILIGIGTAVGFFIINIQPVG